MKLLLKFKDNTTVVYDLNGKPIEERGNFLKLIQHFENKDADITINDNIKRKFSELKSMEFIFE